MFHQNNRGMKDLILLLLSVFLPFWGTTQLNHAGKLYEYRPAPGQYINTEQFGIPAAAQRMVQNQDDMVSLGAFGGYVVLGFNKPVKNDPANPYGVDFTIFGNAFDGSSEPGVVWVMKDTNGNGLPDDTWYEIAGSNHFKSDTRRNCRLTYSPQPDGKITWKDQAGNAGVILPNEFHKQPYYPSSSFFSDYPQDSVSFSGTLLKGFATSQSGEIKLHPLAFGYADNRPVNLGVSLTLPDNPYTPAVAEGAGGDAIDISWAVDQQGNYVELDEIHFVKIIGGMLEDLGWLGESSTEVAWIVDVEPVAVSPGPENLTIIYAHPRQLLVGDTLQLEAAFFKKGKFYANNIVFENPDGNLAEISPAGVLKALKGGTVTVSAVPDGFQEATTSTQLILLQPDSVSLDGLPASMFPGETALVTPRLFDQNRNEIPGMEWDIDISASSVVSVEKEGNTFRITALEPGNCEISVHPVRYPELEKKLTLKVWVSSEKIRVFVTAKTGTENLLPAQWLEVAMQSLNPAVENRTRDYSQVSAVSAAHAVMAAFARAGVNYRFRDDDKAGNQLYLYFVEKEGSFIYGWGGKTEPAAFARGWIVRRNGQSYLRNFDQLPVANGDTLVIYHVPNLLQEWQLTMLSVSPDSVAVGEEVVAQTLSTTCRFIAYNQITESAFKPLVNRPVYLQEGNKSAFLTDLSGKTVLRITENPPLVVVSGNDAVLLYSKLATGIRPGARIDLGLYPNPAQDVFRISGSFSAGAVLQIVDLQGRVVHSSVENGSARPVDISALPPGTYLVTLRDGQQLFRAKLLKR